MNSQTYLSKYLSSEAIIPSVRPCMRPCMHPSGGTLLYIHPRDAISVPKRNRSIMLEKLLLGGCSQIKFSLVKLLVNEGF